MLEKMMPIETVYKAIGVETYQGCDYIVCGTKDNADIVKMYLHDALPTDIQKDARLRFPAIRKGQMPNDDGYYPVVVITGCRTNDSFTVDGVYSNDRSTMFYFSAADNMLLSCEDSSEYQARMQGCPDCLVGKRTKMVYDVVTIWDFTIKPISHVDVC